jgi:uncharacterized protein (TIGR02145 family)
MKKVILFILVFAFSQLYGQEYYVIDFAGEGNSIDSIYVENLTQETSVLLAGIDVLYLMLDPVAISNMELGSDNLNIFPNPMEHTTNIEFFNAKQGNVNIGIYCTAGKQIYNYSNVLSKGMHNFSLMGVAAGSYVISVRTETDYFSGILVSLKQTESLPIFNHEVGLNLSSTSEETEFFDPKLYNTLGNRGIRAIVFMDYDIGDELKFLGYSEGIESSLIFDSPTNDTTYSFVFALFECGGSFTDSRDLNIYQTVQIGDQCWMVENLAYLPDITFGDDWGSLTEPQYAVYGYAPGSGTETVEGAKARDNYVNYGVLYNWAAAMAGEESSAEIPSGVRGVCPPGWHLPSLAEWDSLVNYVVGQGYPNEWDNPNGAANSLKSCRQVGSPLGGNCDTSEHPYWNSDNTHSGFDAFGFSALPGGGRGVSGMFGLIGSYGGVWWSATENSFDGSWYRGMSSSAGAVGRTSNNKECGFSVRCVRD